MNWGRAKNFCFVFFLLINIFLFIMINTSGSKYKLTPDQISAIKNLLKKNNIQCENVIQNFSPKKQLSFTNNKFDQDKLKKIFFANEHFQQNKSSLSNKNKILSFTDNSFEYKILAGNKKFDGENEIFDYCSNIVKKIKDSTTNFELTATKKNNDQLVVEYYQKYRQYLICDNHINFIFHDNTLNKIIGSYRQIGGFFGNAFEIFPPDMLLYSFMKNDEIVKNDSVVINKFDIVYKINNTNSNISIAYPFYRIIYNDNCVMLFDAFGGEILTY